jgi:hypothetical protein
MGRKTPRYSVQYMNASVLFGFTGRIYQKLRKPILLEPAAHQNRSVRKPGGPVAAGGKAGGMAVNRQA